MIHLLHGIHTQGAEGPVEALAPYLTQPYVYPDYGFILALETRRINPAVVGAMLPYVKADDILIGHSNGCCIAYRIALAVPVKGLVFINAALRSDVVIPPAVKFLHSYYNAGDDITKVAQFEAGLPASPVDQLWGDMGHEGYRGTDPRGSKTDCAGSPVLPKCWGHSDIGTHMAQWGPYIDQRLAPI